MNDPPVLPPEPAPAAPPPPAPTSGKWVLIGVLVLAVALVAGGRTLMSKDAADTTSKPPVPTVQATTSGRTVPADLTLIPGLTQEGTFVCAEIKVGARFTGRVEGGAVHNTSGKSLALAFELTVRSGGESESVSRRFQMAIDQKTPSFLMASKSLANPITRCSVTIVSDDDPQRREALKKQAGDAGCSLQERAIEGRDHVEQGKKVRYSTAPPISGNHYATVAKIGVHDAPIANEIQVHNLEHGHVAFQYRDTKAKDALIAAAKSEPSWVLVAPYRSMNHAVAFTAWGTLLSCAKTPGEKTLTDLAASFVALYKDRAPESIPG